MQEIEQNAFDNTSSPVDLTFAIIALLFTQGEPIRIRFEASHEERPNAISRNLVAEIKGSDMEDKVF